MNLNQLVLDKIKKLGATKAAAYFGVSVPTIYSWKSKKNPPVAAVQKILDDGNLSNGLTRVEGSGPKTTVRSIAPVEKPEDHVAASQQTVQFMDRVEKQFKHVNEGLVALTNAILRGDPRELRFWAMKSTDPDAQVPVTSGINPFKNVESGMMVKSAAEVIGDAPQPVTLPKNDGWNEPENPAPNRAPDWNSKINPTDDKNRSADWNRPVPQEKK